MCLICLNRLKRQISLQKSFSAYLSRQVHEVIRILRTDVAVILNLKYEFHQAPSVEVVTTNGSQKEQASAAS